MVDASSLLIALICAGGGVGCQGKPYSEKSGTFENVSISDSSTEIETPELGFYDALHEGAEFPDTERLFPVPFQKEGSLYLLQDRIAYEEIGKRFLILRGDTHGEPVTFQTTTIDDTFPHEVRVRSQGTMTRHRFLEDRWFVQVKDILNCASEQCDTRGMYSMVFEREGHELATVQLRIHPGPPQGVIRKLEKVLLENNWADAFQRQVAQGVLVARETFENPTDRMFEVEISPEWNATDRQGIVRQLNKSYSFKAGEREQPCDLFESTVPLDLTYGPDTHATYKFWLPPRASKVVEWSAISRGDKIQLPPLREEMRGEPLGLVLVGDTVGFANMVWSLTTHVRYGDPKTPESGLQCMDVQHVAGEESRTGMTFLGSRRTNKVWVPPGRAQPFGAPYPLQGFVLNY